MIRKPNKVGLFGYRLVLGFEAKGCLRRAAPGASAEQHNGWSFGLAGNALGVYGFGFYGFGVEGFIGF